MILTGKLDQVTLKMSQEDVTGRMGLSWIEHSMRHFRLTEILDRRMPVGGESNREIAASRKVMAGVLSLIAGAQRVEDIEVLREDRGLLNAIGWQSMISPDTLLEYAKIKDNAGKLRKAQEEFTIKLMRDSEFKEFTYDGDATYFDSEKESATYSYQKKKQHSGMLGFISELGICNTMDFRPGHVSPQTGILNQLRKAVKQAQGAGKKITRARFDSAGHKNEVFEFCEEEGMHYYISLDKNQARMECIQAIKPKDWQEIARAEEDLERKKEWVETVYVTNKGNAVRTLVLRWLNPQPDLFKQDTYCYHAIGTNNNEIDPMRWLEFHNGRMNSENYNKELKEGLNAGYAPSHDFDTDRFYFLLNVLAYNVLQVMKLFYLGEAARTWTVKTLRYWFIGVCGKIVRTGRKYYCKIINATEKTFALFRHCLSQLRIVL
ncbi:MAG: IS1380 family transposase [Candidatus Omnitrophota bacterium]|nr:IS1380 family transposase [Candidatus Omnitrophota bacterium]